VTELWAFPVPATKVMKGPFFVPSSRRECEISFIIEAEDDTLRRVALLFEGVEAYKCTYLTSISAEMFNTAYARIVRLDESYWMTQILKVYGSPKYHRPELQHLMVCFDDGPCYEVICTNVNVFKENHTPVEHL